ncbi:MAG: GH25 family lysozyme [Micromonosporaceae bacterium]
MFTQEAMAMAVTLRPGVQLGPTGKLILKIIEHYPKKRELYVTSAYRPWESGSHHSGLRDRKGSPSAAVDFGVGTRARMGRDLAKWIYDRFAADTVELIHTTPFSTDDGFYVKHGRKHPGGGPYAGTTARQHRDHVHWAVSRAGAQRILAKLAKSAPKKTAPKKTAPKKTAPKKPAAKLGEVTQVWGWDASGHDWKRGAMDLVSAREAGISFFTHKASEGTTFKEVHFEDGVGRARKAGIPVLGAYHVLWPGHPLDDAREFFSYVNAHVPYWDEVPWIWQLDAEKLGAMPRPPSPEEARVFLHELNRLAGGKGWYVVYAPRHTYQDKMKIGFDLWASDYRGSGAPRPFPTQYKGVRAPGSRNQGWEPYGGRKPRILQFASDGVVGRQSTCCVDRFDGTLADLVKLTGG